MLDHKVMAQDAGSNMYFKVRRIINYIESFQSATNSKQTFDEFPDNKIISESKFRIVFETGIRDRVII